MNRSSLRVLPVLALMVAFGATVFATGQPEPTKTPAPTAATPAASATPAAKITINWMLFGGLGGLGGVKDRIAILEKTRPDLIAKYNIVPTVADQHGVAQKLRLALASKASDVPDIISLGAWELHEFVHAGVIEELSDRLKPYKADLYDYAIKTVTFSDGNIYAVPNGIKPKIWYYRKDVFDSAGIDPAKIVTTDDFIAAGKKIQEKFPKAMMWNFGSAIGHYNLEMVASGNDARYFDKDGNYIVASDPGTRKAFGDLKKMKDAGIIANISDWTPDWEQAFRDGTIVSTLQGGWFKLGYLEKWAPDQAGKWAVAVWPEIAGAKNGGGSEGAGGVAFIKSSKKLEAAFQVVAGINLNPDSAFQLFQKRNVEPLIKSAYQKYPELNKPLPFFANNYWEVQNKAIQNMRELPFSANSAKEHVVMNQYLQGYLDGAFGSLDECLKKAEADLKQQIGNAFSN